MFGRQGCVLLISVFDNALLFCFRFCTVLPHHKVSLPKRAVWDAASGVERPEEPGEDVRAPFLTLDPLPFDALQPPKTRLP